jgi:hypothetical protein
MLYPLSFRCWIAFGLALPLTGCSIRPLPENHPLNFPRASTFDIVHMVRCEAKAGLDHFTNSKSKKHVADIIAATSIGYDFSFTMTEDNNLTGGGLTFLRKSASPQPKGGLEVGLTGEATRKRENIRNFRIIEDLADVAKADCSPGPRSNLAYPISGSLRVDEVVRTYIQLERMTDLDAPKEDETEFIDPKVPPALKQLKRGEQTRTGVFSEHLHFQTKLTAGAHPILTLSAVVGSFRLTNATVNGQITRDDDHTLIIAFAQNPNFKDENEKVRKSRAARTDLVGNDKKVVRGARAEAALAAESSEHARNRVALELARVRNLLDDEQEGARFLGKQLLRFLRPPDETGPGD